jgi:DNA-binding CsgD family transcriptional regulator
VLELVALQRGDLDAASALESGSAAGDPFGLLSEDWIALRRAHARGDREALLRFPTRDPDGPPSRFRRLVVEHPAAARLLVGAAVAASQPDRAREIIACTELLADLNRSLPVVVAGARHARGFLDNDANVVADAAAAQRLPWPRGLAHEDAGELLLPADPVAAREQLRGALAAYGEAGATGDAARARATLDDLGARSRRVRARRPRWGWESLTDTELLVANAVSDGLTNSRIADRMFLSRHTVDFHLRHIYRKLGIASRVELTRLVIVRGAEAG